MDDLFLMCKCHSLEHTIHFSHSKEEQEVYVHIYLNEYPNVFKRIWVGLKYMFGYTSRYGHWDEVMLSVEQIQQLADHVKR